MPASANSMTGFARSEGGTDLSELGSWAWTWELKSVNAKGLDVRSRLPSLVEDWEADVRSRVQARLTRGSVSVMWTLRRQDDAETPDLTVNEAFLRKVLDLQAKLEVEGLVMPTAPTLDRLLAVKGVVELSDRTPDAKLMTALKPTALTDLDRAIADLVSARGEEGRRLVDALTVHLDEIADLLTQAKASAECQPDALRSRMQDQLDSLLQSQPPVSEERLAQELALLATKADVREETDRLEAHIEQCRSLLAGGGSIGRKLDFLCQELNREANTLCSKAVTLELTNIGVELKTRIERFREQIQNIE